MNARLAQLVRSCSSLYYNLSQIERWSHNPEVMSSILIAGIGSFTRRAQHFAAQNWRKSETTSHSQRHFTPPFFPCVSLIVPYVRQGNRETGKQGNRETGKQGNRELDIYYQMLNTGVHQPLLLLFFFSGAGGLGGACLANNDKKSSPKLLPSISA